MVCGYMRPHTNKAERAEKKIRNEQAEKSCNSHRNATPFMYIQSELIKWRNKREWEHFHRHQIAKNREKSINRIKCINQPPENCEKWPTESFMCDICEPPLVIIITGSPIKWGRFLVFVFIPTPNCHLLAMEARAQEVKFNENIVAS